MIAPALAWTTLDTPLGPVTAAANADGLRAIEFGHASGLAAEPRHDPRATLLRMATEELAAYFAGELREFSLPLAPEGSPFDLRVWEALRRVPYGQTVSYAGLAELIGAPRAARAVGGANGRNRLMIVLPCHRVVASGGGLGGYACGLERKRWLLDHERARSGAPPRSRHSGRLSSLP